MRVEVDKKYRGNDITDTKESLEWEALMCEFESLVVKFEDILREIIQGKETKDKEKKLWKETLRRHQRL